MIDHDNDGLGETLDTEVRILGMEAMRLLETVITAMKERSDREKEQAAEAARTHQARYTAHAALARKDLSPVMEEKFWAEADMDKIREKYVTARAFTEAGDESFAPYKDHIETRARELHDVSPEQILQGTVPAGPRPMTEPQMQQFITEVAPDWYKVWAAQTVTDLDDLRDGPGKSAAHAAHAATVRADMHQWRDAGTYSANVTAVQEAWERGDVGGWRHRNTDHSTPFAELTEEQRRAYGWRPGGPKITQPLDVDDARLLASTTAPGWYKVQELVTQDVPPAVREKLEERLVSDMTALRATGKLDTASAREEWARFSGHPMSVQGQDPNESLDEFRTRRNEAFAVHWAATEPDRDRASTPHGEGAGKPMSVAQAEEFATKYAPDWLLDRHKILMDEAAKHTDPERVAWEQTGLREQFRYAMEEARDTGGLSHQYAQALRSQAAFNGVDESDSMRSVAASERVRFGGPAARPMSHDEAVEVMDGWAPNWYADQVRRTLRENNMLGESAKRSELDAVRADMTELRDRGTLSTDHAQRLWAAAQPGFDPADPDSRKAMDRRAELWVETAAHREGPTPMDRNNRERFGGAADTATAPIPVVPPSMIHNPVPDRAAETVARPAPAEPQQPRQAPAKAAVGDWEVTPIPGAQKPAQGPTQEAAAEQEKERKRRAAGPAYDTVERRERDALAARQKGHHADAVDAMTVTDYNHPAPSAKASAGRPAQFEQWRERAAQHHQATQKGPAREH